MYHVVNYFGNDLSRILEERFMKAIVSHGVKDFRLEERALPEVGGQDVLVEVEYCGFCGTDVHMYHGTWELNIGCTPGHEVSGVVREIGSKVNSVAPGDPVAVDPGITCRVCEYCQSSKPSLCNDRIDMYHYKGGGFAAYTCVPEGQVYRLKDGTPLEWGAFLEPASCCVHAADRADIKPGQTVAVLGGGAIGLMLMQLSMLSGAAKVVVSEPQSMRRQLASQLGAEQVIDPTRQNPVEVIKDITNGGVDVVFESAGIPVTVSQCFEVVKPGGKIILVGVNDPATRVEFSPYQVFRNELSVLGSLLSHDTYPRTLELISTETLKVQPLISHRLNLSKFHDALKMHEQQKGIKILITPK